MPARPLIIGHRGACGCLPEHTLESYRLALRLGADVLETDIVPTRDGHLICRHDCELSITTNVATIRKFAARRTMRRVDGVEVEGWFVEDFTLDEIRQLRARERFDFRDHSHDDQFAIPSLDDLLDLVATERTLDGHQPGVIIEIKHATRFAGIGLSIKDILIETLRRHSLDHADAPAWVECFEIAILRSLRMAIDTPIIQLLDSASMRPADVAATGGSTTYADLITPAGLREIATYAQAIGAWKNLIIPMTRDAGVLRVGSPTSLIADAHAAGLQVHAWTFRSEPKFLAADYEGDPTREYRRFRDLGIDGVISDFPDDARRTH